MKARQKLECKQYNLQTMGYLGLQTANGQLDKHVGIHIYIYIYIRVCIYITLAAHPAKTQSHSCPLVSK